MFFLIFVLYASVQANTYHDTVRQLNEVQRENAKLQTTNKELIKELKRIKQDLEKAKKAQEQNKKVAYLTFDDGPSANTPAVLSGSKNKQKAIILMHDSQVKTTTVQALPAIIEGLRRQGFSFDVLSSQSFTCHFSPAP